MKNADELRELADSSGVQVDIDLLKKTVIEYAEKEMVKAAKNGEYSIDLIFGKIFMFCPRPKKKKGAKKEPELLLDQYEKLRKNDVKYTKFLNDLVFDYFDKCDIICTPIQFNDGFIEYRGSQNQVLFTTRPRMGYCGLRLSWKSTIKRDSNSSTQRGYYPYMTHIGDPGLPWLKP